MNYLAYHEAKMRGTFDFPIELHYLSPGHPRYQMPFHWHMEYELIFVLQGSFSLTLDAESLLLETGDAALLPGGIIHGGVPDQCIYECIVFDLERFFEKSSVCQEKLSRVLAGMQSGQRFAHGSRVCLLVDQIFEAMEKETEGYEFIITGLLWQMMGSMPALPAPASRGKRQIAAMKRALACIRSDYDKRLTLEQLAAQAGLSPRYFCRAFSQITGRTPIDYLNYYRVECAAERLLVTDERVTDIALACGFEDLSYFTKAFKRYKQHSPQQYRRLGSQPQYHDAPLKATHQAQQTGNAQEIHDGKHY